MSLLDAVIIETAPSPYLLAIPPITAADIQSRNRRRRSCFSSTFCSRRVAEVARLRGHTVTELWPVRLRTRTDVSAHNRRHPTAATTRQACRSCFSSTFCSSRSRRVAEVARLRGPTVTELWPVRLRTQTGVSAHNRRHPTAATTRQA